MAITSGSITRPFRASGADSGFHLTGNLAQVKIGGQVIGLLQKVSITEELSAEPLYEVGSPVFADIALGAIKVSVDGTLIMSPSMPLWQGDFIPRNPYELLEQSVTGQTFDIEITHRGIATAADPAAASGLGDVGAKNIMKINHCRYQSSSINLSPNKAIDTNFKAIGIWVDHFDAYS